VILTIEDEVLSTMRLSKRGELFLYNFNYAYFSRIPNKEAKQKYFFECLVMFLHLRINPAYTLYNVVLTMKGKVIITHYELTPLDDMKQRGVL
jgi:hypothetical protein